MTREKLKEELRKARLALSLYARRSTWSIAMHEQRGGYVANIPQPWRHAAAALGIDEGHAPSDLQVVARVSELEGELARDG